MRWWPALIRTFFALIVLSCGFGCTQKPADFVGTWHSEHAGSVTAWHFFKDGAVRTEVMRLGATGKANGIYSVVLGKLTIDNADATVSGPNDAAQDLRKRLMTRTTLKIVQMSHDRVTLEPPDKPLLLVRLSAEP